MSLRQLSDTSKFLLIAMAMLAINLLVMNHAVSLWDEDEAAYAGFALEMIESGDWVNPEFTHATIHRKTPLHFWLIATSYQLFGVNEFAVRFSSALAIFFTCLLVFQFGKSVFGKIEAQRAAIILASSIALPLLGKIALTDATLLLFSTAAVLSLFNYIEKPNWRWNVVLWTSMALGILTKGPPIILLVGGIWLLLAIFHSKRKNLIGTHPWFFGWLALGPFAAWAYASYWQDYQLWQAGTQEVPFWEWWNESKAGKKIHLLPFLWDWYVLRRIGGSVLGQQGFPAYHFVVLTVSFVPWLPLWFASLADMIKNIRRPSASQLYLILWLAVGWLFWEFMSSKLPSYSLAAQPAVAFWMAGLLSKAEGPILEKRSVQIGLGIYLLVFFVLIMSLPIGGYLLVNTATLYTTTPMSLVLLVLLILVIKHRKDNQRFFRHLAHLGFAFMFMVWVGIAPIIEQSPIKVFDEVIDKAYQLAEKDASTDLIFVGLNLKQRKMSLFYYAQAKFDTVEQVYPNDAVQAFLSEERVVLLIGHEKLQEVQQAIEGGGKSFRPFRIDYQSTDDQLKSHPFYLVTNKTKPNING